MFLTFFIGNSLFRIHCIIMMIWWNGLAPWELEFSCPGSLISTFLEMTRRLAQPGPARKVDVRLPGKGDSHSRGARPVHLIVTMSRAGCS